MPRRIKNNPSCDLEGLWLKKQNVNTEQYVDRGCDDLAIFMNCTPKERNSRNLITQETPKKCHDDENCHGYNSLRESIANE